MPVPTQLYRLLTNSSNYLAFPVVLHINTVMFNFRISAIERTPRSGSCTLSQITWPMNPPKAMLFHLVDELYM